MGEFSPVQLDALEDALEDLELIGIPGELQDDPAVAGRLSEYRELLQLSREALPPVEVSAGVLDNVLALAREQAGTPAVAARAEDVAEQPWWKRISLWIPMLAVGASAALVLVMVRGTLSDAAPEEAVATATKAEAPQREPQQAKSDQAPAAGPLLDRAEALQAAADSPSDGDEDDLLLGGLEARRRLRGGAASNGFASEVGKREAPAEAEEEAEADDVDARTEEPGAKERKPEPDPATAPTDKVIYDGKGGKDAPPAKPSQKSSSGSSKAPARPKPEPSAGGGSVPGGAPSADGNEDPLASAEQDRRAGRCGAARSVYNARIDDVDASVRARALAGLGLCALADGDSKAADGYFIQAKKADATVASFISRERAKLEPENAQQSL